MSAMQYHDALMCTKFYRAFMWKDNGSIQIHISDVRSLYPGCGISDAIIDLYIRYIHNSITYMYMYTHHPYIHNNITYVRYTKAYGCICI